MKGLVLKDLLVLKTSIKAVVAIVVLFGVMGVMGQNSFMTSFAGVYAAILPMTYMAYDERCNFNRFAMVLPVKKSHIVLSKYIAGLILTMAAVVVSFVILIIAGDREIEEKLLTTFIIPIFYHAVTIPEMFKFGVEKGRVITLVIFVAPAMLIMFAAEYGLLDNLAGALVSVNDVVLTAGFAGALVLIYILSIFISLAVVKNKEW